MKLSVVSVDLDFVPVRMRLPLKFGAETVQSITCARVSMSLTDGIRTADGIGETPISVAWGWPSSLPFFEREKKMLDFCRLLSKKWTGFSGEGHAMISLNIIFLKMSRNCRTLHVLFVLPLLILHCMMRSENW